MMAITTSTAAIREGQFVCAGDSLNYGCCTGPRLITRVSKDRLHFERDGKATYMARRHALFVCDTEAEGDAMFSLLYERDRISGKAQAEARRQVSADYMPRIAEMISDYAANETKGK